MKRIDIPTKLSVTDAVSRIAQKIGQTSEPDFAEIVSSAKTPAAFQEQINKRVGSSGFISFTRLPHDKWTEKAGNKVDCYLFVLGNPNLAKPMIDLNPLVGLYVPPRLLVYLHADGFAHICFDSLEETLRDLGDRNILPYAKLVDDKMRALANV